MAPGSAGEMSIVFKGEELFAHQHRGSSSYLLITFSSAGHIDQASQWFLMRDVVQRNDITCIGITSSSKNFFISPEIFEIEKQTRQLRSRYSEVVILGVSMGAYAAIKYSKLFGATRVISFSPQYSLDADELELDEEQRVHLRGGMLLHRIVRREEHKTMAPKPHDIQGSIVIIYDTKEIIDEFAAAMFAKALPSIRTIGLRHIGHIAVDMYEQDVSFLRLLRLVREDDGNELEKFLVEKLKRNVRYIVSVLNEAARRKPHMALRALNSQNPIVRQHIKELRASFIENVLMCVLYRRRDYALAYQLLQSRHLDELPDGGNVQDWSDAHGVPRYTGFLLFSELATFLAYDLTKHEMVFVNSITGSPYLRPVIGEISDGEIRFSYSDGDQICRLSVGGASDSVFRPLPCDDSFAIGVGTEHGVQRVLRAHPSGKCEIVTSDIGSHEKFTLIGAPPGFIKAGLRSGDWFQNTLLRHAVGDALTLEMPKRSPIARLFRRAGASDTVRGRRVPPSAR